MTKGWTFQSLIDDKMTVTAHCHNSACHHSQALDLAELRDRFGPDAPAMADDLTPKISPTFLLPPNAYRKASQ